MCLLGLAVAALLAYALYYYAPAMLGMKTGLPLYVIGSSMFGTAGGYLMPGLLMGVLQIGWFAVFAYLASSFILRGLGLPYHSGTFAFAVVALIWTYSLAWIGIKGIRYVARIATFLNILPFLMIILVFFKTRAGIPLYSGGHLDQMSGFTRTIDIVLGYFATAGAAGADFGMNNRDASDVRTGGFVGIVLAAIFAGGLPLLSIAGAHGLHPGLQSFSYDAVVGSVGGLVGTSMFLLYAVASVPGCCFCAFIAGNSFTTMIPNVPRAVSTLIGVTIALILAVTGVAANLIGFFLIVGASFGPICGAVFADYLLSGGRWGGPRQGINWAGYGAWAAGFMVGVTPFLPLSHELIVRLQPTTLYSFLTGFVFYIILAKLGVQPSIVSSETVPENG